jgi:glycosyltransferase involved in cell wall biosynthesis
VKVLVVHNRYRHRGGEERAVDLQVDALRRAGVEVELLDADSRELGRAGAAAAMLRGGEAIDTRGADVVHVHNMHPRFGPRALRSAREAGARVVLHLHNFRLFCSIATCFRAGEPCFRCRDRFTLPGLVLNCRGSLPESAVYTSALALHQPEVLDSVDAFVTPSEFAAGQLERLGLPRERLTVVPNYLPSFADGSHADAGEYAVCIGRLAPEKGFQTAIDAARVAGVPLKLAGDGPLALDPAGAPVDLLGHVEDVPALLRGAAMAIVPSLGPEVMPFAALEAMAAGVPVIGSRAGSLPELLGAERCVPRGDPYALAGVMRALWEDPAARRADGDALLARARERFSERRYVEALLAVYRGTHAHA